MELLLRILLGMVAAICLLGGINLLLRGVKRFLAVDTSELKVLDNLFRFMSGIYFGLGFLMIWVVFDFEQIKELIYFIGLVVIFSGLGRVYSRIKVGSAGNYFDFIMFLEIVLGAVIMVLQYFRLN